LSPAIDDLYIHLIVPFIELDLQDTGCWVGKHQNSGTAIILQLLNIAVINLPRNAFYFYTVELFFAGCIGINKRI
jgi:hypothetical protein